LYESGSILFQPDIPEADRSRTVLFDLQGDSPPRLRRRLVVIDQDRHDMAVDDVGELVAVGDDVDLVPLAERLFNFMSGSRSPSVPVERGRLPFSVRP
jgi:hypothetical protein